MDNQNTNNEWTEWSHNDKPSLWQRIKWFWYDKELKYFPRLFCRWIKKVFQYAVFLWNDQDYDDHFILRLLQYKIKRTRESMKSANILENTDRYCRQMRYAEALIDRILKDDYCQKERKQLDERWGESVWFDRPFPSSLEPEAFEPKITRRKCLTKADEEQEAQESIDLYYKQDAAREKDLDKLFRHIRKNIQHWWW